MDFRDVSDMASDNSLDFDDLQGFIELFESPKNKISTSQQDYLLPPKERNIQIVPISDAMISVIDRMSLEDIENDPILKCYANYKKNKLLNT